MNIKLRRKTCALFSEHFGVKRLSPREIGVINYLIKNFYIDDIEEAIIKHSNPLIENPVFFIKSILEGNDNKIFAQEAIRGIMGDKRTF